MGRKDDIFIRHDFDFEDFRPKSTITHLKVQNDMMLMAIEGRFLQRVAIKKRVSTPSNVPSICLVFEERQFQPPMSTFYPKISKADDRIAYVHLDPSGTFCLVSTAAGENFVLQMKSGVAANKLERLKGVTISAVAWNLDFVKDLETGFVVLGTTKGALFEANIMASGSVSFLKSWDNVLCLNEKQLPIIDLYFFQCSEEEDKFALLICMPGRLYALCETANFNAMNALTVQPPVIGTVWSGVMVEQPLASVLQNFFTFHKNRPPRYHSQAENRSLPLSGSFVVHQTELNETPTTYLWATSDGLSFGRIDYSNKGGEKSGVKDANTSSEGGGGEVVVAEAKLKECLADAFDIIVEEAYVNHKLRDGRVECPRNIALTEYHALALFNDRFQAISLHKKCVAFEEIFEQASAQKPHVVCMNRDEASQLVWFATISTIFYYRPHDETKNLWRSYMDQKEFGKARKLTRLLQDPAPYQLVIKRESEKFISEKNYVAAAELLAESTDSFEAVVRKFVQDGAASRNGLKRFLELKLNQYYRPEDMLRRDILVIWLLEIQLGELAELKLNSRHQDAIHANNPPATINADDNILQRATSSQDHAAELHKLREELYCFLNRKVVNDAISMNRKGVYRMITNHVDFETQLHLATILKDHDMIVRTLLLLRRYAEAWDVVVGQRSAAFYYKHVPLLLGEIPAKVVESLIANRDILDANQLLRAFYQCFDVVRPFSGENTPQIPQQQQSPVQVELIEATFLYFNAILAANSAEAATADKFVHNFVVHLYATFRPEALLDYLKRYGTKRTKIPYDVNSALLVCTHKNLSECRVFLYCVQGFYEDAVKLALTIDLKLARECAIQMTEFALAGSPFGENLLFDEDEFLNFDSDFEPIKRPTFEQRRRVWLTIIDYVIGRDADSSEETPTPTPTPINVSQSPSSTSAKAKRPSPSSSPTRALSAIMESCLTTSDRPFVRSTLADLPSTSANSNLASAKNDSPPSKASLDAQKAKVDACLEILEESKGALKLHDVYKLFPDYSCMQYFKDPLIAYFREHVKKNKKYVEKMNEALDMSAEIRELTTRKNTHYMIVKKSDNKCGFCKQNLLSRGWYAFFCRHFVHHDCLEQHLMQFGFSEDEKETYKKLKAKEKILTIRIRSTQTDGNEATLTKDEKMLERVTEQMKVMLTEDCPLCGARVLNNLDKPFSTPEEYEEKKKKWAL